MGATDARYISSGHLLYDLEESLVATQFDLNKARAQGCSRTRRRGCLHVHWWRLDARHRIACGRFGLSARFRDLQHGLRSRPYRSLALSPDGSQLALTIRDTSSSIWVYDMSRESLAPLALGGRSNTGPTWTPDGRRITFSAALVGQTPSPYWIAADGSDEEVPLLENRDLPQMPFSWSPDGDVLAYGESGDIRLFNLDGKLPRLLRTRPSGNRSQGSPLTGDG